MNTLATPPRSNVVYVLHSLSTFLLLYHPIYYASLCHLCPSIVDIFHHSYYNHNHVHTHTITHTEQQSRITP